MDPRLSEAASTNNLVVLLELIQNNSKILSRNVTLDSRDTPLHIASLLGHVEFVEMVLQFKPKLARRVNKQGKNPLHLASENGHSKVVKILLAYDLSLCHLKDLDGRNPLHLAVINDNVKVLKTIIGQISEYNPTDKVIYNDRDEEGNTILHHACKRKRWEMVKLLVNETDNMNMNLVNSKGFTALDIVMACDDSESTRKEEIERMLKKAGAKQTSKLEMLTDQLKNSILIMASTFSALSFQMALNPPGGFWQDFAPGYDPNKPFPLPSTIKFSQSTLFFIPSEYWGINGPQIPKVPIGSEHRPGKSISKEVQRMQFFAFLAFDAGNFMISNLMILLVTLNEIFPRIKPFASYFLLFLMFSLVLRVWFRLG